MTKIIAVMILSLALASGQEVRRALPVTAPDPVIRPIPAAPVTPPSAAELGRFLAGQPAASLAAYQQSPLYQSYAREMAKSWDRYETHYASKIRAWSAAELAPRIPLSQPVIYFFGGPDAASPLAFYPDAPVYLLGGLEPVGAITDPQTLAQPALEEGLGNLSKSTDTILNFGFFITKDMKGDLDRSAFRGVLPILVTFLALSGNEIQSITPGTYGGASGVKIVFQRDGHAPQTLYYVSANVADDSLSARGALLNWAGSFAPANVYLKAASYLMQETYFSTIRNFLLTHAQSVLQDDSGIPFSAFATAGWRCWFFGKYDGVLNIFAKYKQPDLQAAFGAPGAAAPLPFGTGYKWRLGESNLMLAVPPRAATR